MVHASAPAQFSEFLDGDLAFAASMTGRPATLADLPAQYVNGQAAK
jgi:hypothetical protein